MGNLTFLLTYLIISFLLTIIIIPTYIKCLNKFHIGKKIRKEALMGHATEFYKLHKGKSDTPTMGGGVILLVLFTLVIISMVIQTFSDQIANLFNIHIKYSLFNRKETYLALFTLFSAGLIGFIDDYLNSREIGRTKGLSAKFKMGFLIFFGLIGAYWFYYKLGFNSIKLPYIGDIHIGIFYIPLFVFIIISMANSVNITDGLDGLAGGLLLFNYGVYAIITYRSGLLILSALCLIIVGSLMAFLWFNIKPAKFYMGDVGVLALGANLGIIAMMTNTLLVLVIISGIYIVEVSSSIIQIVSKKCRNGKKVFKIAPYHHHLEACGWAEETIVMRFWLIGMILSSAGLLVSFLLK
ncbi:MAG: phospho-N-acetylmuramoyl-pentapeptide-transferase [Candidatus Gracilibacteria bacterium]|nr:phospho-N-acetylmuramoyl-pentapeptide-transferase [Candidatus Gracilibacteria bacterium]MDD4530630.1 phospho-N-acetylmuramoyl-pentapeptide-transferase [Candidatus Gracilibacteria bacterium]